MWGITRHLEVRAADQKGVSSRTRTPVSQLPASRWRDHAGETNHKLPSIHSSVLIRCNALGRNIIGGVLIHKWRSSLNNHDESVPLNNFHWPFFDDFNCLSCVFNLFNCSLKAVYCKMTLGDIMPVILVQMY